MFLEPDSQIVAKEVVGAVEMDLSVEKLRSNTKLTPIKQSNRISKFVPCGEGIPISERKDTASRLPVTQGIPAVSFRSLRRHGE